MFIDLELFFRAEYLALFKRPFRLRRWLYVLFFTALFWLMWLIVAVGRALDHLLFPGFRKQEVRAPLFIIAPPRSGTTLTQKLISMDEERLVHVKLYQTIFPCVLYQRLFQMLARLDSRCGAIFSRAMAWVEKRFFGGWDDMHKLRLDQPEEDDGFFVYPFVTEAVYLLFPYVDELWEAGFADAMPPEKRRKLMRYYRSCLQRHLYVNGPDKLLLSKATQFCGSIECLLEEFPDARFILPMRDPCQSVASHVSVFYPAWRAHSPEIAKNSPESRAYARLAVEWYRHLFETRSKIDPRRYCTIRYAELVSDPARTIERVYGHFDLPVSPAFRNRLEAAGHRERSYNSNHKYALEEFGLSREWIEEQLGDLVHELRGEPSRPAKATVTLADATAR